MSLKRFAFALFVLAWIVALTYSVTVGGTSSITGPFLASILLGIADVAGKYYGGHDTKIGEIVIHIPDIGAFVIYTIMIVVLILRPQGLFARGTAR